MIISSLDTYFLEVSDNALLKVTTKNSFRGKEYRNLAFLCYFSEVKTEECNQNIEVSSLDLALSYRVQIHSFWK